jgi:hypothetical protein
MGSGKDYVLTVKARSVFLPRLLFGFVSLLVFLVQASHPGLHPVEVIDANHEADVDCPIGHAIAELSVFVPPIMLASPIEWRLLEPLPWQGHTTFVHGLAPRPPPVSSL